MPILKSSKKSLKKSLKNRAQNTILKKKYKNTIKEALILIEKKDKNAGQAISKTYSLIDKVAKKNIDSKKIKSRRIQKKAKA